MYEAFGSNAHRNLAAFQWWAEKGIAEINKKIMTEIEENKTEGKLPNMDFETATADGPISKQEENWMLMTTLQIPWKDANAIDDPVDRKFLMGKVVEVQGFIKKQQEMEMQHAEMQRRSERGEPESGIITPQDILQGK